MEVNSFGFRELSGDPKRLKERRDNCCRRDRFLAGHPDWNRGSQTDAAAIANSPTAIAVAHGFFSTYTLVAVPNHWTDDRFVRNSRAGGIGGSRRVSLIGGAVMLAGNTDWVLG